jgi:hypothetical protein
MGTVILISVLAIIPGAAVAVAAWRWPQEPVPWKTPQTGAATVIDSSVDETPANSTVLVADRRRLQIFAWCFLVFPGIWILIFGYVAWYLHRQDVRELESLALAIAVGLASYVGVRQALLLTQPLDLTFDEHGVVMRIAGRRWAVPWELIWYAALRPRLFMSTLFVWTTAPRATAIVPAEGRVSRFPGYPGYVKRHKAIALAPAVLFRGGGAAVDEALRVHARFISPVGLATDADEKFKRALTRLAWVAVIGILVFLLVFLILYSQAQDRTFLD